MGMCVFHVRLSLVLPKQHPPHPPQWSNLGSTPSGSGTYMDELVVMVSFVVTQKHVATQEEVTRRPLAEP